MLRLFSLFALLLAPGVYAQGVLSFASPTHDFGTIDEGVQATYTFEFTNTGDAPAAVVDVRTSCGCTAPSYTTDPVAPGETGELTVVFDSNDRPGPFQKRITVRTASEAVALQITGTVVPDFAEHGVAVGSFLFDTTEWESVPLAPGEPLQHAFKFQNTGDRPLRILEVTAPAGVEVVTRNTIVFPGGVAAVALTAADPGLYADAEGQIRLPIMVETNDDLEPVKELHVVATMRAAESE